MTSKELAKLVEFSKRVRFTAVSAVMDNGFNLEVDIDNHMELLSLRGGEPRVFKSLDSLNNFILGFGPHNYTILNSSIGR